MVPLVNLDTQQSACTSNRTSQGVIPRDSQSSFGQLARHDFSSSSYFLGEQDSGSLRQPFRQRYLVSSGTSWGQSRRDRARGGRGGGCLSDRHRCSQSLPKNTKHSTSTIQQQRSQFNMRISLTGHLNEGFLRIFPFSSHDNVHLFCQKK